MEEQLQPGVVFVEEPVADPFAGANLGPLVVAGVGLLLAASLVSDGRTRGGGSRAPGGGRKGRKTSPKADDGGLLGPVLAKSARLDRASRAAGETPRQRAERQRRERQERADRQERERDERILDRAQRVGVGSLSADEKRRLQEIVGGRRNPRRNPPVESAKAKLKRLKPAARRELQAALALNRRINGPGTPVYELSPSERRRPPRFVAPMGLITEQVYAPDPRSKKAPHTYRHRSGDRGAGKPKSPRKPLLAIDPRTKRPIQVQNDSPMRAIGKWLVG